jgi:Fic family protein
MPNKRTDEEKLEALIDALGDSILEANDDEILEEIRMSGVDINAEATRLKAMMLAKVKAFRQRPLEAARVAYSRQIEQMEKKPYSIPETAEERRELFLNFTQNKSFEQYVTAQYRNLETLTDNDIETYLEDLAELGILQKHDSENDDGGK